MKKIILVSIIALSFVPSLVLASEATLVASYTKVMSERLNFGLNRNANIYNKLIEQRENLSRQGKNLSVIDLKLTETKMIIDHGQKSLVDLPSKALSLTASSTPRESYFIIRKLVREIIVDIRQSYAKIKEIKLLIKDLPSNGTN